MMQAAGSSCALLAAGLVLGLAGAAAAQVQVVTDPSFEVSGPLFPAPGPWSQYSMLFDTPLCNGGTCLGGEPSAARTGDWWAWFGGSASAMEHSTLTQNVTLPAGTAQLRFYLIAYTDRISNPGTDWLKVFIDSTEVFGVTDATIGPYTAGYTPVAIDVSAFAGGSHTLKFECITNGELALTNFFVDDVTLDVAPSQACYANCDGSTTPPILNVNDFVCFQTRYAQESPQANCDGSTAPPVLNVNDFICFQTRYAQGCP